jgi:uracil-DNA glycosylase family 4
VEQSKLNILAAVKGLLQYHQAIGIGHYPQSDSIEGFLRIAPSSPAKHGGGSPVGAAPGSVSLSQVRPSEKVVEGAKLTEIAEEIVSCHACNLHAERIYPVVGKGSEKIRLLIVGDWLSGVENEPLQQGLVFGKEQDDMVDRMLSAINLPKEEVFITNVIKCAVPQAIQPQASNVRSCISYLRRQIIALSPDLICTMGMVASKAVLEKSIPLSRLRGAFHQYKLGKEESIPVLTTYHPTYLLQNPEMKQATWVDLQLAAKKLGLRP